MIECIATNLYEQKDKSAHFSLPTAFHKMCTPIYVNENTFYMHVVRYIRVTAVLCKFVYAARSVTIIHTPPRFRKRVYGSSRRPYSIEFRINDFVGKIRINMDALHRV